MKRTLLLLTAASLLLSLCACGKDAGKTPSDATDTQMQTASNLSGAPSAETSPETTTLTETTPAGSVPAETMPAEPSQEETQVLPEGWPTAYATLVDDFRKLIAFRMDPNFQQKWESEGLPELSQIFANSHSDSVFGLNYMIHDLPVIDSSKSETDYGYMLHDLNADGTPELFWVHKNHTISAIFTYHNGKAVLLDAYWSRYSGHISDNNTFYTYRSGGAAVYSYDVLRLKDGTLTQDFSFGSDTTPEENTQYYYETAGEITIHLERDRMDILRDLFPGEHSEFWLSLPVIPLTQPSGIYESATKTGQLPYTQNINRKDFPVWSGPGYDYTFVDTVRTATVYTIVAEVPDLDGNLWGKLKSGLGWVDLTLIRQEAATPPIISANFSDADQVANANNHQYKSNSPGTAFTVYVYETVTDMTFCSVHYEEDLIYGEPLFSLDTWTPDKAFVADANFPGDMSMYAIRFTDSKGTEHTYLIGISGRNGSLYLISAANR